jgi:7-cyano-7-deazaguanine synthase
METKVVLHTPLMWRDKAQTFAWAQQLETSQKTDVNLLSMVIEDTHTCYKGDRSLRHAWGYGCGACPACHLRKNGWEKWQAEKKKVKKQKK